MPTYPMRPMTGGPLSRLLSDSLTGGSGWLAQPKVNGWRALIHVPTLSVWNRHGDALTIADEFQGALEELWLVHSDALRDKECGDWLDCEMLSRRHGVDKGCIIVFDCPQCQWPRVSCAALGVRVMALEYALPPHASPSMIGINNPVCASESCILPLDPDKRWAQLQWLWLNLQQRNKMIGADYYEGIVLKRCDSLYEHQTISASRETTAWIKCRFDQYHEL